MDNLRNELTNNIKNITFSNSSQVENSTNLNINDLKIGMDIYVGKFMNSGILLSLPNKDNEVQVQIGSLKSFVPVSDISIVKTKNNKSINTTKSYSKISKSKNISPEINVIGQTVDEAIFVIDKYLDDCSLAKLESVRIVHGKGTGKLRAGIHNFLKTNPHVKSFRLGTFGEGEMGVTIVELK